MKSLSFTLGLLLLLATTVFTSPTTGKRLAGNDIGDRETESVAARKRTKYATEAAGSFHTAQPTADEQINLMLTLTTGASNAAASGPTTQPDKDHLMSNFGTSSNTAASDPVNCMLTLGTGVSKAADASVPTAQPNTDQANSGWLSLGISASNKPKNQPSSLMPRLGTSSNAVASVPNTQPTAGPLDRKIQDQVNVAVEFEDVEALKELLDNNNIRSKIVRHAFNKAVAVSRKTHAMRLQILQYLLSKEHGALDDKAVARAIVVHIEDEPVMEIIFGLYKGPLKSFPHRNIFKKALLKKLYKAMRLLLKSWGNISRGTASDSLAKAFLAKDLKAVEILLSHKDILNTVNANSGLLNDITTQDYPPSEYEDALKKAVENGNVDAIHIIIQCKVPADFDVNSVLADAGEEAKDILVQWDEDRRRK